MDPPYLCVRIQPPIRAPALFGVYNSALYTGAELLEVQYSPEEDAAPFHGV
jgi:hypothetical protein